MTTIVKYSRFPYLVKSKGMKCSSAMYYRCTTRILIEKYTIIQTNDLTLHLSNHTEV